MVSEQRIDLCLILFVSLIPFSIMSIIFFSFFDWHFSSSLTHEYNSTPASKPSSSMAESCRKFTIGCALATKKRCSLIQPSLVNLSKERRIDLIKIDNETPLIEQPQFDLIQIFGRTPDLLFRNPDLIHNPKIEVSAMQALMASASSSISGQIPACLTLLSQLRVIDLIDFKKLQNLAELLESQSQLQSQSSTGGGANSVISSSDLIGDCSIDKMLKRGRFPPKKSLADKVQRYKSVIMVISLPVLLILFVLSVMPRPYEDGLSSSSVAYMNNRKIGSVAGT